MQQLVSFLCYLSLIRRSGRSRVESNSRTIAAWNFTAGFLIHYYYCETRSYRCHLTGTRYTFVWPALETQRLC